VVARSRDVADGAGLLRTLYNKELHGRPGLEGADGGSLNDALTDDEGPSLLLESPEEFDGVGGIVAAGGHPVGDLFEAAAVGVGAEIDLLFVFETDRPGLAALYRVPRQGDTFGLFQPFFDIGGHHIYYYVLKFQNFMKVVIPGGTGHVGAVLRRHFESGGHEVVILSRTGRDGAIQWDGERLGDWAAEIDGSDVVINLAGRSVDCRYTQRNLDAMWDSRVNSTRVVGEAIRQASRPPKVWLQASTATIYAHRFDAANDDETGIIGDGGPLKWRMSVEIAKAWEKALDEADTPRTRKVAMRTAMTMSADAGSIFDVLCRLTRRGFGGRLGDGTQYVSWIHEHDFARIVDFLIAREDVQGPVNVSSPYPLPQEEFMRVLRRALGVKASIAATAWMVEIGAWLQRTESELVLKSRRVVPSLLLGRGYEFTYPHWLDAARELIARNRS